MFDYQLIAGRTVACKGHCQQFSFSESNSSRLIGGGIRWKGTGKTASTEVVNPVNTVICSPLAFSLVGCEKKRAETEPKQTDELIPVTSLIGTPPKRALGESTTIEATDIEIPRGTVTSAVDRVADDSIGDGGGHVKILKEIFKHDTSFNKIVAPNFRSTVLIPGEESTHQSLAQCA